MGLFTPLDVSCYTGETEKHFSFLYIIIIFFAKGGGVCDGYITLRRHSRIQENDD